MTIEVVLDLLRCPHCHGSFTRTGPGVRCENGHAYDVARHGYLNLLSHAPPPHADSAAMVEARERFLGSGSYARIADALASMIIGDGGSVDSLLDVGAGPGYYLAQVLGRVGRRGLVLDISPYAARRAARAHPAIGAVVADAWGPLPVADAAVEVVLSVFAPRQPAEFARVLRPDGLVIIVSPLEDHLVELREPLGLLEVEPAKQDRIASTMTAHFVAVDEVIVRDRLTLSSRAVLDLVSMGPNAFHQTDDLGDRVAALGPTVAVTLAVSVRGWRRQSA